MTMSAISKPDFFNSEFVYFEKGEIKYDDDAPESVKFQVDEFNKNKENEKKKSLI